MLGSDHCGGLRENAEGALQEAPTSSLDELESRLFSEDAIKLTTPCLRWRNLFSCAE
jgi:hypothetical protein